MPINFTEQQQKAIVSRGGRLIVSAAAGSGKTAVLVQRVIGLLCDDAHPCSIDRLLVVTFTNAAASEMRAKIASALLENLAADPQNANLKRQLALLPQARIQTVHSFCMDLIRAHASQCDVSPDFALSDETEYDLLKESAMDELLERRSAEGTPAFEQLCDAICEERGDRRLAETVLDMYERLRSHPDPEAWLARAAEGEETAEPGETRWGAYLLQSAERMLRFALERVEERCAWLAEDARNEAERKWQPVMEDVRGQLGMLLAAAHDGWDALRAALGTWTNPRAPRAAKDADRTEHERCLAVKARANDIVKTIRAELICAPAARVMEEAARAQPIVRELCALVREFGVLYDAEKKRRNLLDFSDLEHLALRLLRTPVAREVAQSLDELLVDEYQDTNEIQDTIFAAVTPEHGSVFLVGDVKQSIYKFRLAEPEIFVKKYLAWQEYDTAEQGDRRLALNRNFRSREEVLSLCNFLFSRLMTREFGDIDYTEDEALHCGASYPDACPAEFHVVDMSGFDGEEDSPEKALVEARFVAARLSALLREMRVFDAGSGEMRVPRPGDCAILLSSFRSKAPYYAQALAELSIPSASGGGGQFFGSLEISVMLSYLRLIDNRRQDVPLISVLRSPLYFFTADELCDIRAAKREGDFFDALCAYAETSVKANSFLAELNGLCDSAADLSVSELLSRLYGITGARGVFAALDGGAQRHENLARLYELARGFESSGARGLSAFLRAIDRRIEKELEPQAPAAQGDAVQIMSIHRSKGLEFPIVVVPDLAKQFNTDSLRKPVLFHEKLGIGLSLRDEEKHTETKTQMHYAVRAMLAREQRAEELRKLYVALTRAKEKLILVMALPNAARALEKWAAESAVGALEPERLAAQSSAAAWIGATLLQHAGAQPLRAYCGDQAPVSVAGDRAALICSFVCGEDVCGERWNGGTPHEGQACAPRDDGPWLARMKERYAHARASELPSKLTPTGAKKLVPDAGELYEAGQTRRTRLYHQTERSRARDRDAARRGTALHAFLEHGDHAVCARPHGCVRELERLEREGILERGALGREELWMAESYFESDIARRVAGADRVWREYEFSALFTPDELLGDGLCDEEILMNGTIDLLIREGDALTVIDFKSDRAEPGAEAAQAEKYRLQLSIYGKAAEKIFGLPVRERLVFFLRTGSCVSL